MERNSERKGFGQQLYTTLLLVLVALVGITAATAAWFSIADTTQVHSMRMDITSGPALRFDVVTHGAFEEYLQTLSFERIADHVKQQLGYDMRRTPIEPVTTEDGQTFTLRSGKIEPNTSGAYWEFTLNFRATHDMVVHLTSADSAAGGDGTAITSSNSALPESMRISFTMDGKTMVFDPGAEVESINSNGIAIFGLPIPSDMVYNNTNALFSISKNENKPVLVHIWMEGTDEACTDALKRADFSIRLRFEGTDEDGNRIDGRYAGA